eukprot:TRINITY_DN3837_c0_g1_i1.p1 TRINITY_DN3837_c0_g1~~TRINITY_DN3837_c0_g1_i1.p1  ORF type:complete len:189 (-),score=38.83 TRINITY_DN3837_c0_g1_i1:122-688(-)
MFWAVWVLVGIIWTFGSSTCQTTAPSLYVLCITILGINIALAGIAFLCCIVGFIFGLIYFLKSDVQGASKSVIEKLESQKYVKGLFADEQDAQCAICLNTYEEGDDLRFLPCQPKKHHFHLACVDEWLKINKTCPFCKHAIDAEPSTTTQDLNEDTHDDENTSTTTTINLMNENNDEIDSENDQSTLL